MAIQLFDWYNLFVNEVVGSLILFILLGLVVIAFIAAKAQFPLSITLGLSILFMLYISFYSSIILIPTIILLTGFLGWVIFTRMSRT